MLSGIDVARGSLRDAAIRVRDMRKRNKLTKTKATLICADLGADVPGRKKSPNHRNMQKLLTWSLQEESEFESESESESKSESKSESMSQSESGSESESESE